MNLTPQQRTRIIIAAGAAVVLLVVIGIVIRVVHVRSVLVGERTQMEQAQERLVLAELACEDAQDPELCRERSAYQEAEEMGSAELCNGLQGEAYATCVHLAAQESGSIALCERIDGEARVECEDDLRARQAEAEMDLSLCNRVSDAAQDGCRDRVTARIVDADACASAGVDEALCANRTVYDDAVTGGDEESCYALSDPEFVQGCLEDVRLNQEDPDQGQDTQRDDDADGLTNAQEAEYGSDPLNPDTDGDGFTDGSEVQNGYSPIGPGLL